MADAAKETEPRPFTLRDFVELGRERLHLDVVVGGEGLQHEVLEPMRGCSTRCWSRCAIGPASR